MPSSRIPSPARSQGVISTPRKQLRRTRSVGSPARTNLRLSSIIESYKVSPVPSHQSVLNDDTDIELPRRGSWWKKINDNSRDVLELLERKELVEVDNVAEEFDVEVLSQEKKNYTLDLPESSDGESICSIVIPQRNLFIKKDHQPQIKFGQVKNNRETLQKLDKSYVDHNNEVNVGRKTLFSQPSKTRTKPVFPAALLNISANKTINKTKEIPAAEVKGQVRSLFGGRPGSKRKNMFANFIVSESEDDIPEIQPKVFGFQKRNEPRRRASSMSRHSPTSSIDLEMEDWRLLPSSTMVENHNDEIISPVKRIKLSNLLETKDSEISTNSNHSINKTKQINKSVVSKNKSKNISNTYHEDNKSNEKNITPRNNRVTRSMGKSLTENSVTAANTSKNFNKTENYTLSNPDRSRASKSGKTSKNISQRHSDKVQENQNILMDQVDPDEDFTLEYDNDDNEVLERETSIKNENKSSKIKTARNVNVNLEKESRGKISKDNLVEHEELLDNKQNENEVTNYSKIENNSQEKNNLVEFNRDTNVRLNRSIEKEQLKNESKSMIRNSVEKYNDQSKDMPKKNSSQRQSNKNTETSAKIDKSNQNLNEENAEDQEMESEIEENECDNPHHLEQRSDKEEEVKELTNEENNCSEIEEENAIDEENNDYEQVESNVEEENESEHQENENQNEHVTEEEADNEEQTIHVSNIDERDKEIMLDCQSVNIKDSNQDNLPNVSHDTTGRHRKIIKSPEAILHDKTKQIDSFTVQGRNTSVRKTKSIIFHNKLETVKDFHRTTGFSDGTCNSSAEGSGWDSHRTTRKTLRQTFGKDFTPRKSLRALVMEKTAKLQANFTEIENNVRMHQANSTEYDNVQDELDSNPETELVQFEQNIKMIEVEERNKRRDGTEQFEGRDETDSSKERDKRDQSVERVEMYESEEREEMEGSEEGEEMEQSEERKEMEQSKEREEMEQSEEREEMSQSGEREEMEQSEQREEMEQSEEKEKIEESDERDQSEQSENEERDMTEDLGEKDDIEQSENEEREESEQSENEERQESEQSENEERQESEESENEERNITEEFEERDDIEQSENEERQESEQSENEERRESEQSENEERDKTEEFGERDETVHDGEVEAEEYHHEVSKQTRQTSLETYLQKIKQDNAEKRRKMQEELRNSLKNPKRDTFNMFKVPQIPVRRTIKIQKPKTKQIKSVLPLEMLPSEVIEDMKYKPPKRFQPNNASWITKRLYKFLENKLESKYDYKARIRAEKLVQCIYSFTKEVRRHDSVRSEGIEELKREMARLDIVKTHFDFYEFCHEFFPREIRTKIVPDIVNNISLPRHGVFSNIL